MVQVSCNQRYESKGTAAFQACAVTEQNCVAKKYDEDLYPAPPKSVLVSDFDTTKYKVRFWMLSGNYRHACSPCAVLLQPSERIACHFCTEA